MTTIDTEEKRVKRMKQLKTSRPSNLIRMQSRYGIDADYIPGADDGEPNKGDLKEE